MSRTDKQRIVVPAGTRVARFAERTLDPTVMFNTVEVPLQQWAVRQVIPSTRVDVRDVDPDLVHAMWGYVNLQAERFLGFVPACTKRETRWTYNVVTPKWYDVLRRMGLRPKRRHWFLELYLRGYAASTDDYDVEAAI